MRTTAPGLILSTSPPGRKNAGALAGALGYGKDGAIAKRLATSRKPVVYRLAGVRAKAYALAATMPMPRNAIAIKRAGSALPTRGSCASAAHGSQMGVTLPFTWRCGPSDSAATMSVIRPIHLIGGLRAARSKPTEPARPSEGFSAVREKRILTPAATYAY